jgi:thiol-disulfide isomerase/thioredoxin
MNKRAVGFVVAAALVIGAMAALAIGLGRLEDKPAVTKTVESGSSATPAVIFAATYTDLNGKSQTLSQWSGKLLIINFWASWCAPCLEEMPLFVDAQRKYGDKGLQIIGIAADSAANSSKFAQKLGVNYPVFPDEAGAIEFSKRTGNRFGFLPYTIILTPAGDILPTKLGVFSVEELTALIEKNLPKSVK